MHQLFEEHMRHQLPGRRWWARAAAGGGAARAVSNRLRPGVAVAVIAAAVTVVAGTGAAAAGGGVSAALAAPVARTAAAAPGGPTGSIFLITGDRLVAAGPPGAGTGMTGVVPAACGGLGGAMLTVGVGSNRLDFPLAAVPYLGHGLDPGLFRVSLLRARETRGTLPVTIAYQGQVPALPGVRITSAAGGTARGYLTAAGARAFGQALARQFTADHDRGSYGQDGMSAGGVSVRLAGTPAPAPAPSPQYPMHTLTVTGTTMAGKPDTGDVLFIFNADNTSRFSDLSQSVLSFYHGMAKFSVPAGHYWAIGFFATFVTGSRTRVSAVHVVVLPQFTVASDTTMGMDARSASSRYTVATPRPTVRKDGPQFDLRRTAAAGPAVQISWGGGRAVRWFASPTTRRPTVGTLRMFVTDQLVSPATAAGTPYEYNLAYAGPAGIIPLQRHVVRPAGLARVHARYYSDINTTGFEYRYGLFPGETLGLIFLYPVMVPRRQTEYMTGNPAILWFDAYIQSWAHDGGQEDSVRVFRPGEQMGEDWNAYPLHPGYNANLAGAAARSSADPVEALRAPSASRVGDTLQLDVAPFSDSTPGHRGLGGFLNFAGVGTIAGHYQIDENGKQIAAGDPLAGDLDKQKIGLFGEFDTRVTLSPHPSRIRFVLDASRTGVFPLSTASHTEWTWRSAHEVGDRLPAGWVCRPPKNYYLVYSGRSCAVEPMMTLGYQVAGMGLNGATRAGRQVLHIRAGHLQLIKNPAKITRAAVAVSFDGGQTWRRAYLTGHAGRYTAVFTAPAGVLVTLRASAADAAGGRITETITSAYQTAS
jgi:hypothetical protein